MVGFNYSRNILKTLTEQAISTATKEVLATIARASSAGVINVTTAAKALHVDSRSAGRRLASLARRGWATRVRRGVYLILPLEAAPERAAVPEDPWLLARELFSPCYIGGWSAAEHWGLTEQIFRSTLVITAANIRSKSTIVAGQEFFLYRVPRERLVATTVWRGQEKIPVSDRERTLIDCLRNVELCGGARHLGDLMQEYGRSPERNFARLLAAARDAGNGATWKRLGYLAETLWSESGEVTTEARRQLTTGNAKLDPTVKRKGKLITRWNLWANVPISRQHDA